MQLNLLGDELLVFTDAGTRLDVRASTADKDGNYGLIETGTSAATAGRNAGAR